MFKSLMTSDKAKTVIKYSPVVLAVGASAANANTPATPIITATDVQPIADSIIATATMIAPIALGVMAAILALRVGMGLVKSLISKAT
ncbi:hypothetical protein [Acinetobacter venetianus]|uniref:hypothetical protein n=1 Tax=Acinetobacter venetianus TaxID=52133 RepID=UPI003A952D17